MNESTVSGPRMSTYERDGLSLAYSVVGEGAPVLFIHGATGTGLFDWGSLADELSSRYSCVMPDLCGHGRSDFRRSDYSGEEIESDLLHLIDHLRLERPHVVGFSYGAEIALTLELRAPGTVRSLVLVSPGTGRSSAARIPSVEYLQRVWPPALRRLHEAHHGPDHWRSLVAVLQEDSARRTELPFEVLKGVGCPVLLLAGDRDDPARQRQGRRFAEVNPLARYVEITGAAHAAHLERPDKVARMIGDFLAEVDAPAGTAPVPRSTGDPS
jgi:3-oxoadipate enol-lactonase